MSRFGLNCLKSRNGIDKKALGRGIGSGCGKTSSYGHKGGKARSGRGKVSWFEGGQMPIYRRLPHRGFRSCHDRSDVAVINLDNLQFLVETGKLKDEVSIDVLRSIGAVRSNATRLRVLARGELKTALTISATHASEAAIKAIEAAGGKVNILG